MWASSSGDKAIGDTQLKEAFCDGVYNIPSSEGVRLVARGREGDTSSHGVVLVESGVCRE